MFMILLLWLAYVVCLSIALVSCVRAGMLFSSFLFLVRMRCLWCCVLRFVVPLVCRACMCCCWFVFVLCFVMV